MPLRKARAKETSPSRPDLATSQIRRVAIACTGGWLKQLV